MGVVVYPLHLRRKFELRWAARRVRDEPRRSPPQGTDTCSCGQVVTAPINSTYTPLGVVNEWRCAACGKQWNTTASGKTAARNPV